MVRVITVRLVNPQQILTTVMTRIVVDKTIYHVKPHSICLIANVTQYQRMSWQLNTPTWIWKCTRCIMQMSCLHASDSFKNFCKPAQHVETIRKKVWGKSNDEYSLLIRVQTMINHILICFLSQCQRQRKCFFQSASLKRHCVTHWREQRGKDSYLPRQIRIKIVVKILIANSEQQIVPNSE